MIKKITYKDIDENTVSIYVNDIDGEHYIGIAHRNGKMKWELKAYFPVEYADLEDIEAEYDGPVEAGRYLVKAWDYYNSQNIGSTDSNFEDIFFGDLFK